MVRGAAHAETRNSLLQLTKRSQAGGADQEAIDTGDDSAGDAHPPEQSVITQVSKPGPLASCTAPRRVASARPLHASAALDCGGRAAASCLAWCWSPRPSGSVAHTVTQTCARSCTRVSRRRAGCSSGASRRLCACMWHLGCPQRWLLQQGSLLVTHKGSLHAHSLRVLWGLPRRGQPAIPQAQRAAFIPGVHGFARAAGAPQTCEQGVPGVAVQGGLCPPAASAAPLPDCAVAGFASGRLQQSGPAAAQ
jgi:hypothetical protein